MPCQCKHPREQHDIRMDDEGGLSCPCTACECLEYHEVAPQQTLATIAESFQHEQNLHQFYERLNHKPDMGIGPGCATCYMEHDAQRVLAGGPPKELTFRPEALENQEICYHNAEWAVKLLWTKLGGEEKKLLATWLRVASQVASEKLSEDRWRETVVGAREQQEALKARKVKKASEPSLDELLA